VIGMTDAPLPTGKLPASLLGELLSTGQPPPEELRLAPGIGEDAGVIQIGGGALVVTTDPITMTGRGVAAHAVRINANDVAVTGARPQWFLCTVLLPEGTTETDVRELFSGLHQCLRELGITLVGGHTEITPAVQQPLVCGQMLGYRADGHYVRTGGVQPGDVIVQVGPAPVEGAAVLAAEAADRLGSVSPALLRRAQAALDDPGILVVEPALRATELGARALHDPTEGGLSAGLHEMAEASGTGLEIDPNAVRWFEPGLALCRALGLDPWGTLASGTLLAAFPPGQAEPALEALGPGAAIVGRASGGGGVRLADGTPLKRYERDELSRVL
jgi:hydrogenase maturation factor